MSVIFSTSELVAAQPLNRYKIDAFSNEFTRDIFLEKGFEFGDDHSFEKKLKLLEGLARGEKAILEDRIVSYADAKKRMARWLE